MDSLQQNAWQALHHVGHPMSAGEVAAAIGARLIDAQDALGYLVRHGGARRHHCDDAVMRYSATAAPPQRRSRTSPTADAVLAALDAGHRRACAIGAAVGLSPSYASAVLHRLEAKGLVSQKSRAEWRRVHSDAPISGGGTPSA